MINTKTCRKCGLSLPVTEFCRHGSTADGLDNRCKHCEAVRCRKSSPSVAAPSEKQCASCGLVLEIGMFYKNRLCRDGHRSVCKGCISQKNATTDRGKRRDAHLRRVARIGHVRGPRDHKDSARSAVHRAIKAGKLPCATSLLCKSCGEPAKQYHHHNGYDKPNWLEVVPVCTACHAIEHSKYLRNHS